MMDERKYRTGGGCGQGRPDASVIRSSESRKRWRGEGGRGLLGLVMLLVLPLGVRNAAACSCAVSSLSMQVAWADYVFTGRVVAVDTLEYELVARLVTDEVFKGAVEPEFSVATSRSSAACGYNDPWARFEVGEDFLLFAYAPRDEATLAFTTLCSRNTRVGQASADLNALRSANAAPYVPIAAGNTWSFVYAPFADGEVAQVRVTETSAEGDRVFFGLTGIPSPADTLWTDAMGNVWGRQNGADRILLDFFLDPGVTYPVDLGGTVYTVRTTYGRTVNVALGRFEDCALFEFAPEAGDVWSLFLAPAVGPILLTDGASNRAELLAATISGKAVVSTEPRDVPDRPVRASVHPNPVFSSATVTLELDRAEQMHVSVHDALGRELALLHDAPLSAGRHALTWSTVSLPAGTYFVRIRPASGEELVVSVVHL